MTKKWAAQVKRYRDKWEPTEHTGILKGPALNKAHCSCNHWA